MWKNIYTYGTKGSEGGEILLDEDYRNSCRITLEKCPRYYAITCGVYGAMVHTVFRCQKDYQETYYAMKEELAKFVDRDTTDEEEYEFFRYFTDKYV